MSELVDPEAQREEEDGDQLTAEDTLEQIVVDDILDEGYSPDERDTRVHWGETALEELLGEPLDVRLAQELPDVWDQAPRGRESDRAGRIESNPDGVIGQDWYARDVGVAGGAASAEEAAMHTITLDELQETEDREAEGLEGYDADA